jgi:hypothetical protein
MSDAMAVELSQEEIRAGLLPETTAFMGQTEDYTAMTGTVRELIENGHHEALYIPAVKFIVGATLGIVTQPQVEARLPKSVTARSQVAIHFSEYVADVGLRSGMFIDFYTRNADLQGAPIANGEIVHLADPNDKTKYLASIGGAPFYDSSLVSGGALNFLEEQNVTETPAGVIKRSPGLLAVSGVYKGLASVAFDYLGAPYASAEHFRLVPGKDETELAFTEETAALLRRLNVKGRGCPSAKIASPEKPAITVLEDSWHRIVDYLVPLGATADVATN